MAKLFDAVSAHYNKQLPFVVYRKPNKNRVFAFLMKDTVMTFASNFEEKGFVFAPFSSLDKSILFQEERAMVISEEIVVKSNDTKDVIYSQNPSARSKHLKLIKKAIETVRSGTLQKVVISREELQEITELNIIEIYEKLLSAYDNAFVYVWFHPQVGLWFGATPETLLSKEQAAFTTMSLAGTQVYKEDEKVVWKSKELEEQQLVTTFIESQLENIAGHLIVNKTETIKAGNLLHLRTKVSGSLKKTASLQQLIRVLHPTPAVCGLPRAAARSFILENESYNRSYYTGFLGELNLKNKNSNIESSALFVNLRCMKIENKVASIFVGGGITKDSNAEKEWEETVSKSKTMKRVLYNYIDTLNA